MRHRLFYASGLLALATLVLVARPAAAQTTANGPYYATPAWDQTLACTTLATCPRFIVLSNMGSRAVLDRETGLVWEQRPDDNPQDWGFARFECTQRTTGGRKGWRLPSVHELASLLDPVDTDENPDLSRGHPFTDVKSSFYWSATTDAEAPAFAWGVNFGFFFGVRHAGKGDRNFIWCVRGGMNADAY